MDGCWWMDLWASLWGHLWWKSRGASSQHYVVPIPTAPWKVTTASEGFLCDDPIPQIFLPSLNAVSPQAAKSKSLILYALLSAPLSAERAQQFLMLWASYALNLPMQNSRSLSCLEQNCSILSEFISSWLQSQAFWLQDGPSSAHTVCLQKN